MALAWEEKIPPVWRRAATLALLVGALAVVVSSDTLHGAVLAVFAWAEGIIATHQVPGAVLFVVLSALSAMFLFVSSAVLVPVALVTWGRNLTLVLLWGGWLLGGASAYAVARFLGRPTVMRFLSRAALRRYESWIGPRTPVGLVLLFQLAVPSEIPGYVLGLARYPLRRYLPILAVAELPYAIGAIALGTGLLERKTMLLLGIGTVGILFSVLALYALRRRLPRP